jgi:hypothetical protein
VLKAVENVGFFYVPFALLFFLLARITWSSELLRRCLLVLLALAAVFVLVGLGELADGSHLLFNRGLDQDAYFVRINSLFYDPNIYGRFLALTMILLGVVVLFERRPRGLSWLRRRPRADVGRACCSASRSRAWPRSSSGSRGGACDLGPARGDRGGRRRRPRRSRARSHTRSTAGTRRAS